MFERGALSSGKSGRPAAVDLEDEEKDRKDWCSVYWAKFVLSDVLLALEAWAGEHVPPAW